MKATTMKKQAEKVEAKVVKAEVTREALLAVLQSKLEETVAAKGTNASADEVSRLEDETKIALEAYNKKVTEEAYDAWNKAENPVKALIMDRFIPGVLQVRYTKDKKTGEVAGVLSDVKNQKASLNAYAHSYGYDCFPQRAKWWNATQRLAYLFATAINKELTGDAEIVYAIDQAAQTFNFAADAEPTSKTSRVKALKMIFDMILEDAPKADSHDIVYIEQSMSKNGGCGKIAYMNTHKMEEFVIDALHMRLSGKGYTLDTSSQKAN